MRIRPGLALILVVGVLGILAVLGSAFAVLSRLERRAATQRVMGTQAFLLARSGLEDAQARLDSGQVPDYGGEDWNNDGILNSGPETDSQAYRPGVLNRSDCPVRQAMRPSFFRSVAGDPKRIEIQGRVRGYSGSLGGENATWSLKAVPDGGFPVNGGDPSVQSDPAATSDLNTALRRMFAVLAEAIDREDGVADGSPIAKPDGEDLIGARPPEGWRSFEQIRDTALGGSQVKLEALRDYLQLGPWTDLKVAAPSVDSTQVNQAYRRTRDVRTGNWEGSSMSGLWTTDEPTRGSPDLERSPRTSLWSTGGSVVGRAPVDLAWARTRRPALLALLGNLSGIYWQQQIGYDKSTASPPNVGSHYGRTKLVRIDLDWAQATDDCRAVADLLIATTSDLSTWQRFNDFCEALPLTGASDLGQAKKDLLKANFNPNTDVRKFNPEASFSRLVDKSDLLDASLELNLAPRNAWRVSCVGRFLSSGARSERTLTMRTRPDLLLKLTSQGEFLAGSLGRPEILGDESGFRPLSDPLCATPSDGLNTTFGHRIPGAPASGVSLQSYPEPYPVCAAGLPALYDGQLKLATVETGDNEYTGGGSTLLLSSFDDAFDADRAAGSPAAVYTAEPGIAAPSSPLWPPWDAAAILPGSLYPNGANLESYLHVNDATEEGTVFAYSADGNRNIHPFQGAVALWFKPDYRIPATIPTTTRAQKPFTQCYINNYVPGANGSPYIQAYFMAGSTALFPTSPQLPTLPLGFIVQNLKDSTARNCQATELPVRPWDSRWYLGTFFWDLTTVRAACGANDPSIKVLLDRGQDPADQNIAMNRAFYNNWGIQGPTRGIPGGGMDELWLSSIVMGAFAPVVGETAQSLDELAIYDLGPGNGNTRPQGLALQRFAAGRYYKEDDGAWFSAPIDLGDVRLRTLSWTQIVPRGLRAPGPLPGGRPEDGDAGPDGRITLELSDASGSAAKVPGLFADSGGERVARRITGPFRLHAVFQPNLSDPDNTAILDPLALDDVTVSYRPEGQSALSAWSEGE